MSEQDGFTLKVGGQEYEASRDNLSLFTFFGHLACYNHAFLVLHDPEEDEAAEGMFIFASNPGFEELANYMFEHNYPMHLNLREVGPGDRDAFDRAMLSDLTNSDSFPEEWK